MCFHWRDKLLSRSLLSSVGPFRSSLLNSWSRSSDDMVVVAVLYLSQMCLIHVQFLLFYSFFFFFSFAFSSWGEGVVRSLILFCVAPVSIGSSHTFSDSFSFLLTLGSSLDSSSVDTVSASIFSNISFIPSVLIRSGNFTECRLFFLKIMSIFF